MTIIAVINGKRLRITQAGRWYVGVRRDKATVIVRRSAPEVIEAWRQDLERDAVLRINLERIAEQMLAFDAGVPA